MNRPTETAAGVFATANSPQPTSQPRAGRALGLPGIFAVQEPNVRPVVFINSFLAREDQQVCQLWYMCLFAILFQASSSIFTYLL